MNTGCVGGGDVDEELSSLDRSLTEIGDGFFGR